jgi:hypothetical protein
MPKKTTKKPSVIRRRWLKYAMPVLAVLIVGLGGYALFHKSPEPNQPASPVSPNSHIDYSPATKADNAPNNTRKSSSTPATTLNNYQPPANTGSYSVTITRAGLDNTKQNLQAAAIVRGVTDGTCSLNIHKQGQATVTRSVPLSFEVNSYACPAITIPVSEFPVSGAWDVSMTVVSDGQSVTSDWVQNPVQL